MSDTAHITDTEQRILLHVGRIPTITIRRLAQFVGLAPASTYEALIRLERKGLIKRHYHKGATRRGGRIETL